MIAGTFMPGLVPAGIRQRYSSMRSMGMLMGRASLPKGSVGQGPRLVKVGRRRGAGAAADRVSGLRTRGRGLHRIRTGSMKTLQGGVPGFAGGRIELMRSASALWYRDFLQEHGEERIVNRTGLDEPYAVPRELPHHSLYGRLDPHHRRLGGDVTPRRGERDCGHRPHGELLRQKEQTPLPAEVAGPALEWGAGGREGTAHGRECCGNTGRLDP